MVLICAALVIWQEYIKNEFQELNNFESDPEEFARIFCKDMGIEDPEVGVSTCNVFAFSIFGMLRKSGKTENN